MHFPGDGYLSYLQDVQSVGLARQAHSVGYRRLFFWKPPKIHWPDGFDEIAVYDAEHKIVRRLHGDKVSQAPVWDIAEDSLEDLLDHCENSESDTLFIFCSWGMFRKYSTATRKYAERKRWLYETANNYRGKINLVAFGSYDFELYFCIGLSGGALTIQRNDKTRILPDGTRVYRIRELLDALPSEFGKYYVDDKPEIVSAMEMALQIPVYQKNFYSIQHPRLTDHDYTPNDVRLGYLFRNTRLKPEQIDRSVVPKRYLPLNSHFPLYNDGVRCDSCSLSYACKLYRPLGACTLPGSSTSKLVELFSSDKAEDIAKGLSSMLGKQAEIAEDLIEMYDKQQENPDPEHKGIDYGTVRTAINDLVKNGIAVAKFKEPNIIKPPIVKIDSEQVSLANNAAAAIDGLSQPDKAALIRKMVAAGYSVDDINPETMFLYLNNEHQPQLTGKPDNDMPF